jgi:hypothetical protein
MEAPLSFQAAAARLNREFGESRTPCWTVTIGHGYVLLVALERLSPGETGVLAIIRTGAGESELCRIEHLRTEADLDTLVRSIWTAGWDLALVKREAGERPR